jgi:hypothetical protein
MNKKLTRYFFAALSIIILSGVFFTVSGNAIKINLNKAADMAGMEISVNTEKAAYADTVNVSNISVGSFAESTTMGGGQATWNSGNNTTKSKEVTASLTGRMAAAREYITVNFSATVYDNNTTTATDEYFYFYAKTAGFSSGEGYNNVDGTKDYSNILARKSGSKTPTANDITLYMAVRSGSIFNPIDSGFKNVKFTMSKSETAAPAFSVSNGAKISSASFTVQDSQSGLYSYSVINSSGTTVISYTNPTPSNRIATAQTITLPGIGAYTVTAEDNLGNSSSITVYYYIAQISVQAYCGGSINTTGGTVGATSSGGSAQYVTSYGAIGSTFVFYAAPNNGYYLNGWAKTSGNGTYGCTAGSLTKSYTIVDGDAYAPTLWFDAYFNEISTADKIVTYNGNAQGVDAPAGLNSGLSAEIKYNGSSTVPKNVGTYTVVVRILYGTEQVGTKTVSLEIRPRQLVVSWSAVSIPYREGIAQKPVPTITNLQGTDTCTLTVTGEAVNAGTYTATITAVSNANYSLPSNASIQFTITKLNAVLSAISSTPITYGQSLGNSTVTGTSKRDYDNAAIPGTWSYTNTTFNPTFSQSGTAYSVTFYPSDTVNYNNVTATCAITVYRRTAALVWANTTLIYNRTAQKPTATVGNLVFSDTCSVLVTGEQTAQGSYVAIAAGLSNDNYALPANAAANFTILPLTLTLLWSNTNPVYDGNSHLPSPTATNILAGDTCEITVAGAEINAGYYTAAATAVSNGNYALPADPTVNWRILPKELSFSFWQSTISFSYRFTGARILPVPVVTDPILGALQQDRDYTVAYGENYSCVTGGSIKVTGINNYQNQTEKTFFIEKATQNAAFFSLVYLNSNVRPESIAKDLAEFEVTFLPSSGYAGNYVTAYVYTDAVFPETFLPSPDNENVSRMVARKFFLSIESPGTTKIISDSAEYYLEKINNVWYSVTRIKIYLSDADNIVKYGINTLTFAPESSIQYDYENISPLLKPIDDGYTADFGSEDASPLQHKLFIKKNHTASGSFYTTGSPVIINKEYGNPVFQLTAGLNSGRNDFTMTSDNPDLLAISGSQTDSFRTATILNAGTVVVRLHHPGFVTLDNLSNSYAAIDAMLTVVIAKANLSISPADKTVVYGSTVLYDKNSFVFNGLKNGDTSAIILSVQCNYRPDEMKNTGTYSLTASGAVYDTSVSSYQNYNIYYPPNSGNLTITKKPLYAYIEDTAKTYGQDNPAFPISYEGFVEEENESTALDFIAPSINYNNVANFTDIGQYTVYLSGGSARNYNIIITDTARLTITPVPIEILLQAKSLDYNAMSCPAEAPELIGVAGGTTPGGSCTVYYLYDGNYELGAPVDVGLYTVKIVYTRSANDNYEDTEKVFEDNIRIRPIAPAFLLDAVVRDYDTLPYDGIPSLGSVAASVPGGSQPTGSLTYLYSREGGEYTAALPQDSGSYSVRVIYLLEEGMADNYLSGSARDFIGILTIEKAEVSIELSKAQSVYRSSDGISPDRLYANAAVPHGIGTEYTLNAAKYPYEMRYRYFVDGNWQEEAPYNAGSYRVEVTFCALGDLNYKSTIQEFSNAVEILRASPTLSLAPKTTGYTGSRISQNAASATGIAGGTIPEGTFEYLFAPHGSSLSFFSKDYLVVNVNPDGGGYDVLVRFIAGPDTNYTSTEQRFVNAITILPVVPVISLKAAEANFTGAPYDISRINASAIGISGGSIPSGELIYQFLLYGEWLTTPPMEVGSYSVKVTFTPKPNVNGTYANYLAATATFADAIKINKVNPAISIQPFRTDYTGERIVFPAENIKLSGVNELYPPLGIIDIQYGLNNQWSYEAPIASNTYNIRVSYLPGLNENYNELIKIFNGALVIDNIAPVFADLVPETHVFNGQRVNPAFELKILGNPGTGTMRLEYQVNGAWTNRAPADAGEYNVRVAYTHGTNDNYKSYTKVYPKALIITPRELVIRPQDGQTKPFDNIPAINILYSAEGLLATDCLTGFLCAGASANAGRYEITQGDLRLDITDKPAGYENNYIFRFVEGIFYTITPAEVQLAFSNLSPSVRTYRSGDSKSKYISVHASDGIFDVPVSFSVIGDDVNAGTFRIQAILLDSNYVLPAVSFCDYTITPAAYGDNDISFTDMAYTYDGSKRSISASVLVPDSVIAYSYGGNNSDAPFEFTDAGTYEISATVSHPNYYQTVRQATLTIRKATPELKVYPLQGSYFYNDPLPVLTCSNADGTIQLDPDQILLPSVSVYRWTFVPEDTNNYNTVHGVIPIAVQKLQTSLHVEGQVKQSTDDPRILTPVLATSSGDQPSLTEGSILLTYTDKDGNVYTELPTKAGKYTLTVTFSGDSNYAACTYSTIITVTEPANNKWLFILMAAIGGIALISLIAGLARRRRV